MKRFFAALLTVMLLATLLPVSAFAETTVYVSTTKALKDALETSGNHVVLTDDISIGSDRLIMASNTTLDGMYNGVKHTITVTSTAHNDYGAELIKMAGGCKVINCCFESGDNKCLFISLGGANNITIEKNYFNGRVGRAIVSSDGVPSGVYIRNNEFGVRLNYGYCFDLKATPQNLYIEDNIFHGSWLSANHSGVVSYKGNTFEACNGRYNYIKLVGYPSDVEFKNTFTMASDFVGGYQDTENVRCYCICLNDVMGTTSSIDLSSCSFKGNGRYTARIAFDQHSGKTITVPAGASTSTSGVYKYYTWDHDIVSTEHEHSYEIRYDWNGSQCTATAVCPNCDPNTEGHTVTETATGSFVQDTAATCTSPAKGHYTASFTNPLFKTQSTAANSTTSGSTLPHSYGNWTTTKQPTCTEKGVETRYCSCGAFETREVDALGHKDENNDHKCDRCEIVLAYVVNFVSDGETVATKTVTAGQSVTFPTAPEKADYAFLGWSTSEAEADIVESYTPSGDSVEHTLTAVWKSLAPAAPVLASFDNAVKITDTDKETGNVSFSAILGTSGSDYTLGTVEKVGGVYTYTVTLNDAADYVNAYRNASFAEGKDKVVFEYGEDGWFVKTPAEITTSAKTVTVTFVQPTHKNGVFPTVEAITVALTAEGTAKVTLPDCNDTDGKNGTWVYVFRGWHQNDDDQAAAGSWIDENTEITVSKNVTFIGVWRLASLTGDKSWNFRDAMSIMDHIDNSKAFEFCPEQLAIANFDLDMRGTINYRDAMAIMSYADHSLEVFPFPDDNPKP